MKEFDPRLTRQPVAPKLEVEGNNFMADGTPPGQGPEAQAHTTTSPDARAANRAGIDAARRYVESLQGRDPGADERQALMGMVGNNPDLLNSIISGTYNEGNQSERVQGIYADDLVSDALKEEARVVTQMLQMGVISSDKLDEIFEKVSRIDAPADERNALLARLAGVSQRLKAPRQEQAEQVQRQELKYETGQTEYEEQDLITDRKARDKAFSEFFAIVDSTPNEQFDSAFNPMTIRMDYERFMSFIRKVSSETYRGSLTVTEEQRKALVRDFKRYQTEKEVRQSLHDANYVLYFPLKFEQLAESLQRFRSELGDYANRIDGVREMGNLYEAALREDMAANDGYLRQEAVLNPIQTGQDEQRTPLTVRNEGDVARKVKERFRKMWISGQVVVRDMAGKAIEARSQSIGRDGNPTFDISDWEIDRIFSVARGMMIADLRLVSLAAESKLPRKNATRYTSLWLQDLLQGYAGLMHGWTKFNVGEKALRPYLYTDEGIKRIMGIIGTWRPGLDKKLWKLFEENPRSVFDPEGQIEDPELRSLLLSKDGKPILRYIQRLNPNRCGDIFTWLSWRVDEDHAAISAVQRFIAEGEKRMWARDMWRQEHPGETMPANYDFGQYLGELEAAGKMMPKDYDNQEYSKWIGTGLRFEKLRGRLANYGRENIEHKDKVAAGKARESALKIMGRMADLQPHRLYLISERVRARLAPYIAEKNLTQDQISTIVFNLSVVESAMYNAREDLLNQKIGFDEVQLDQFWDKIADEGERAMAKSFAAAVKADFETNTGEYEREFIAEREFTHGYVLWSGDAPVDEFNMGILGDTAGYARRLRDNMAQAKAFTEEGKLLDGLKHLKKPEDLLKAMEAIYKEIANYDAGKAKEAIYEKLIIYLKFFKEESLDSVVPIAGLARRRFAKTSAAQLAWGKEAPSWGPTVLNVILNEAKEKDWITEERYEDARKILLAEKKDEAVEAGISMSQLLALAVFLYILTYTAKEEGKHL